MAKRGFNDQWIEICRVGSTADSTGKLRELTSEFLSTAVSNYNAGQHEAPLVVGHPETDTAPAFGWASTLRMNGDVMEFQASDTDDEFERLVSSGRYKKRSASFYLEPPNLRHIGFLGAQPPAIKGLRDIKFAEGESFALIASPLGMPVAGTPAETLIQQETTMKEEDLDKMPDSLFEKLKAKLGIDTKKADLKEEGGGNPIPQPAAAGKTAEFNEESVKTLIAEAVKEVSADFKEQLDKKDEEMKELRDKVDSGVSAASRSEIASFVEALPAEKGKHFLKQAGIAEFLESLAVADAADKELAICFSEGEGDDKQEHKFSRLDWAKNLLSALPSFIQFGEKFGNLDATKAPDPMVNSDRVNAMKDAAGVETKKDGGKD